MGVEPQWCRECGELRGGQRAKHSLRGLGLLRAVMERTGLSTAPIYRLIWADDFQAAIRMGSRAVGWGIAPASR